MQQEGKLLVCTFDAPGDTFSAAPSDMEEEFWRIWESGGVSNIKAAHFEGRSQSREDYTVRFVHSGENETPSVWTVSMYLRYDAAPFVQTGPLVIGRADTVRAAWTPSHLMATLCADGPVDFAALPCDTLTVSVRYEDGGVSQICLALSFDEQGSLVVRKL